MLNFFMKRFVRLKVIVYVDANANAITNAEMLMPRFPNRPFNYTKFHEFNKH